VSAAPIRYPFGEAPEAGSVTEVAEGILWIRLPLPMALDHVNCYALRDDDGWTIVDTGLGTKKLRAAWEEVISTALAGAPVRRVVITHHHPDHVGLAGWFAREHGAELAMPRTAYLMTRMLQLDVQERYEPETLAFWRAAGMDREVYEKRAAERPFNFADVTHRLPIGYTRLREGDRIEMGGRTWLIRMGNGHAPEHATFWCEDEPLVLGGDQLLASISPNVGIHATEPEEDPLADWLEACTRLAAFARPDQLVLPGHKLPYTGLPARLEQLAENHHSALDRLTDHLREPRTAAECFPVLFKRRIGPAEYGLALVESMAHVMHLYRAGRATRRARDDGAWLWRAA